MTKNEKVYNLEYLDETHTYLINGAIVPSVTQLLKKKFTKMYEGVPKQILNKKAIFGNNVHKAIELIETSQARKPLTILEELSVDEYLELKSKYSIEQTQNEILVHFKDKYAGRLDMMGMVNGEWSLLDIKTTEKLEVEMLRWQLSLYDYALRWKKDYQPFKHYYCVWVPKKAPGKLVKIDPLSIEEIEEFLNEINCKD